MSGGQRHSKNKLSSRGGGLQARVRSDLMVLMMARRKAGLHKWWPKKLKGELKNNSRKPRVLLKNRHSDSLKKELTYSFAGDVEERRC